MSKIIVNGSLIPSVKNTPLDIRTRINTIAEVESIQVPFIGMIFYVIDEEKFYVVKSLKGSKVGNIELPNTTVDVFEPLIKVEVDDVEVDLSAYATIEKVEELIAAIEHPQYDDSELRRMFVVDEPKKAVFNNRPYIFACGHPVLVEKQGEEVVITYSVNDTNKNVGEIRMSVEEAKKLVVVGGFSNENINKTRVLPATNIRVRNVDIQAVYGGHLFNGDVGEANIVIENSSVKEIIGGGDASRAIDKKYTVRNTVSKVNVKLTDVKSSLVFIGGAGGPSTVAEARIELNENCDIAWLTAGGSNGFTAKSEIIINGGKYECVQMTNRGLVDEAKLVMNGGHVNRVYFAGEAEDETVTGIVYLVVFELNNGEIGKLARGNSNSIEYNGEIKGHIMNCVVVEGDVSMLEVKVEEEVDVNIDLSEYAKIEFVEEQIAAIELKEGPAGQDGAPGADGQPGKDGEQGPQGISVTKVEIVDNHLMVILSDGRVLDAGEISVEQGSGAGMTPEQVAELESLKQTKQQLLDMTYGVEYEWIYEYAQPEAGLNTLGFNRQTAPKFFEDLDAVIEAEGNEDAGLEAFVMSLIEQDIYRLYVLRINNEHRIYNRYEIVPFEGNEIQPPTSDYLAGWNPTENLSCWNWDGDPNGGIVIDAKPSSGLIFALLKVKK